MKARRWGSSSVKQEFLKNWMKRLGICRKEKKGELSILERTNVIKLSSDMAMASTRKGKTQWSRAVLDDVVSSNKKMVQQMLGHRAENRFMMRRLVRRRRINVNCGRKATRVVPKAKCVAWKMVKNKRRVLRKLVPGGEEMDGGSLIRETLDYIVSLRLQVDVMGHIAATYNPST